MSAISSTIANTTLWLLPHLLTNHRQEKTERRYWSGYVVSLEVSNIHASLDTVLARQKNENGAIPVLYNMTNYSHIAILYIYRIACSLSNTDDSNLGKRKRNQEKEDEILMDIVGIVEEASCDLEEYSFKVRSK